VRRYDSNPSRQVRHRAFAGSIEQSFGFETPLQLLECDLQRA
jgi:hypothetical protein